MTDILDPVSCASQGAPRHSVLHIESDDRLRKLVTHQFRQQGFESTSTKNFAIGLEMSRVRRFALIITSLERSPMNVNVCLAIRRRSVNRSTPILAIAKEANERDIVTLLDGGADDCLTAPFGMPELCARMRALLRRKARAGVEIGSDVPIALRNIEIDRSRWLVRIGDRHIQLTHTEFDLLHLMFSNPGVTMTREKLSRQLWPDLPSGYSRRVDSLVKRVRRKVESDRRHPQVLLTVRGIGYCAAECDLCPG